MLITEPVALVLATAGVILVGMIVGTAVPRLLAGHGPFPSRVAAQAEAASAVDLDPGALIGGLGDQFDGAMSSADRIVRIVAWVFLLVTAAVVGASNLWPDTSAAIYILLGLTGLFVLAVYDLMPSSALGAMRYVIEGTVALVVATLLLALTGGHTSPFFFTFPLIVGAASLVVQPRSTLVLAAGAIVGYLVAAFVGSGNPTPAQLVTTAANLTALLLLAFVGSVIGGEQRRSRDAAIRLSAMDPLTGLFNRTLFFAALEREMDRSARSGRGFCLLMMDLDELKAINDRYGHHAGDVVLREIADRIRSGVRRIDVAARYGGDEFVALLPETDPTGGWVLAEKIRLSIAALDMPGIGGSPTVSVGVVAYPRDGETVDALMVKADLAMYASKRAGRNRVAGPSSDPTADLSMEPTEVSGRPV